NGGTPYNLYGKFGWNAKLLEAGPTGFGVDYTWTENVSGSGDKGQGVGVAAVQVLRRYGIELYTQFRWYSVDRAERPHFADIFLGPRGGGVRLGGAPGHPLAGSPAGSAAARAPRLGASPRARATTAASSSPIPQGC